MTNNWWNNCMKSCQLHEKERKEQLLFHFLLFLLYVIWNKGRSEYWTQKKYLFCIANKYFKGFDIKQASNRSITKYFPYKSR